MKNPYVDDLEHCMKDTHVFILFKNGELKCHYCGIDFKEFRKKEDLKK